jgi:hypothetical protein
VSTIPLKVRDDVRSRSQGLCECGCGQQAQHLHHRKLRSQGGKHDAVNLLHLAYSHHAEVHADPARGYERGYLVHSWDEPVDVPVLRWGAA